MIEYPILTNDPILSDNCYVIQTLEMQWGPNESQGAIHNTT